MTSDFRPAIVINNNEVTVDLLKLFNIIVENTVQEIVSADGHAIVKKDDAIQSTIYELVKEACEYVKKEKGSRKVICYLPRSSNFYRNIIQNKIMLTEELIDQMFYSDINFYLTCHSVSPKPLSTTVSDQNTTSIRDPSAVEVHCRTIKECLELAIMKKLIYEFRNLGAELLQVKLQLKTKPTKYCTTRILMGASIIGLLIIIFISFYYMQRPEVNISQKN